MHKMLLSSRRLGCALLLVFVGLSVAHWKEGKLSFGWSFGGARKIVRAEDGVVRRLDCSTPISLFNGSITKFEPEAVIKLQQEGGEHPCEAELRERAGKLELWIKDEHGFHPGDAADDAWLPGFLQEVNKQT